MSGGVRPIETRLIVLSQWSPPVNGWLAVWLFPYDRMGKLQVGRQACGRWVVVEALT
ncbi:MAG: hypothetical protein LAO78_16760 [Acidobacteriia bacterium]|nr:hypothetical protein [Terriglobia bacterium]